MREWILLLEDQAAARRSLAQLLRATGYDVRVATNVLEAQALCSMSQPAVALLDVELPGVRGDEWAVHLRESSPDTRIIFISGRPGLAGLDRFGPDVRFVHKPIVVDDLLDVVEEAMRHADVSIGQ